MDYPQMAGLSLLYSAKLFYEELQKKYEGDDDKVILFQTIAKTLKSLHDLHVFETTEGRRNNDNAENA